MKIVIPIISMSAHEIMKKPIVMDTIAPVLKNTIVWSTRILQLKNLLVLSLVKVCIVNALIAVSKIKNKFYQLSITGGLTPTEESIIVITVA